MGGQLDKWRDWMGDNHGGVWGAKELPALHPTLFFPYLRAGPVNSQTLCEPN